MLDGQVSILAIACVKVAIRVSIETFTNGMKLCDNMATMEKSIIIKINGTAIILLIAK